MNMVPNAWLTRKWCLFGHLNFIITFSMHSLKYARVFHPYEMLLKYWRSKLPFPGLWGWTKLMLFRKKFIKSSWSMEVTILQKLGQKMNRVTSLLHLLPNTFRTVDVLVTSSFTLTKMSWTMLKNLNWFNPMSCVKIRNTSSVYHSHTSMLFIGCIAHCILSLKNKIK